MPPAATRASTIVSYHGAWHAPGYYGPGYYGGPRYHGGWNAPVYLRTPGPPWAMPNECFTDEGYGRFTPVRPRGTRPITADNCCG